MRMFTSPHFSSINIEKVFNAHQEQLPESLKPSDGDLIGSTCFRGIPFDCGTADQHNVILLDGTEISIDTAGIKASYILFVHAVENRGASLPPDLADMGGAQTGNDLGDLVSEYQLEYTDGSSVTVPIYRRFAIQQPTIGWGASPFAAVPGAASFVTESGTESELLGKLIPNTSYGGRETRVTSGRDHYVYPGQRQFWIYALPNPNLEKPIGRIVCVPKGERSVIYAISHTMLKHHPLRDGTRRKLQLTLPEGARLNALGELESAAIDLGTIISARAVLTYDREHWFGQKLNVQPDPSNQHVIIEYAAHPMARLYIGSDGDSQEDWDVYEVSSESSDGLIQIPAATRPVKLKITEQGSDRPVAVRLHLHGSAGEYLPPKGNHRKVNPHWFEDNYGEFVNGLNQYAYVPGECVVDLPLGEVFVEITRGYEVTPLRTSFRVKADTKEVAFELERVLQWRDSGWVSADTHVHFLSPQTALLEGQAEGVNVVNLLASQWGEMFSNVSDFDGHTTFGARDMGGDGEYVVRVGTENRMQVLGHISLLGYSGRMIQPLCSGGPSESAVGDALEVTMADWARNCIEQNGLVVMPHAPNPQGERAADIVLGLIHAIEMMTFNPFDAQISPYGLADWYRYLNLGYQIPIVGGSDKMSAASLLGGVRTYAQLGDEKFSYENWMAAVKAGNTFVTVGPLVELQVEGRRPGESLQLPATGGTLSVAWRVDSVSMPIERVEVVVGGLAKESISINEQLSAAGSLDLRIDKSTWIALRVRGSYRGNRSEIAAHSSAVQIIVDRNPLFSEPDALAVIEQIEGAIAYVDTLAPRPDAVRFKKMRLTLEAAHSRMHQRLHQQGLYHKHASIHNHAEHREH
jgi:hypothetical protein